MSFPRKLDVASRMNYPTHHSPKTWAALVVATFALFVLPQAAQAATYYWDNNGATTGFGAAGGTWAGLTADWTTDPTGGSTPTGFTTSTSDALNFGNGATGLGAGTITVTGGVSASSMTFSSGSGAIVLSSGGTITLAAATTITVNNPSDTINSALGGAATSFTMAGTGILNLGGASTFAGTSIINGGTLALNVGGSINNGSGTMNVGGAGGAGTFTIAGGSYTNSNSGNFSLVVGAGSAGIFNISSGSLNLTNAGGGIVLGNAGTAAWNQTGGTVTLAGNLGIYVANAATGASTMTISGGSLTASISALNFGTRANSTLSISNSGTATVGSITLGAGNVNATNVINLGDGTNFVGGANIAVGGTSGVLSTGAISRTNGSLTINFMGGTLRASAASATFLGPAANVSVSVQDAGGVIDNGGNAITLVPVLAHGGVASTDGGLIFKGFGVTTLTGTSTYTGGTTIAQGNSTSAGNSIDTLKLDFSTSAAITNIINSGSVLTLGGGIATNAQTVLGGGKLLLNGKASTTNSQTLASTTIGTGGSGIVLTANATANPLSVNLGAITRTSGGVVDFTNPTGTISAANGILTSTGIASTILTDPTSGTAYATVGGSDWAAKDATNAFIVPGTVAGIYTTANSAATFSGNADITGSLSATAASTVNSIRFNTGSFTLTLAGINTISTGGVLFGSGITGDNHHRRHDRCRHRERTRLHQ